MAENNDRIYELLDKLDCKMDDQTERLVRLEVNVERNSDDLEHHIKRTDLLEQSLNKHKSAVVKKFAEIEAPKNTAKSLAKWIAAISAFVATVAGAAYGVIRLYKL